jgi:Cdc6-like AAA superfamily ATPase
VVDPKLRARRLAAVAHVFTPSAPISDLSFLSGRLGQISDVVSAVSQRGQHVALYGERGVGKTSLANILGQLYSEHPTVSLDAFSVNCSTNDDFFSLWRSVFRETGLDESDLPPDPSPEDVRHLLAGLPRPAIIVIDELDRIEDDEALSLLADTIKSLSDHSVPSTLVLVGVANSVMQLIGDHRSIERALVQVGMPRMSMNELVEIMDKGCDHTGLIMSPENKQRISRFSEGLPHYTHLLALHAAQLTVREDRDVITNADVDEAMRLAVEKHSIRSDYQLAVRSAKSENLFPEVLLACALAPKRDLGYFPAGAVREPLSAIRAKPISIASYVRHLNKFTQLARGAILQQEGEKGRTFYRFANPLLQPYVILHGLSQGLLTEEQLLEFQRDEETNAEVWTNEPQRLF